MARGAQKTAEDAANTGRVNADQFNKQLEGGLDASKGYLTKQYQNLISNPGYDPATKSAITLNSEGAAAASYGGASDALARSAARTGNSAGITAGEDKLAQDKAATMSGVAAKDQIAFADRAKADQTQGLQGLSSMYGMDMNMLARSLGIPVEYLNSYIAAGQMNKGGFTGAFSTALGKSLGTFGANFGPGGAPTGGSVGGG